MKYKELNRRTDTTVTTTVEFTFNIEGKEYIRQFEIPHFNPKGEEEILKGICNRYESELRDLKTELEIKENTDVDEN